MQKQKLFSLLLCLVLLCSCLSLAVPAMASANASDMLARAKQGVVQLYVYADVSSHFYRAGVGTGFAVGEKDKDSNVFVTNRHVITMSETFAPSDVRVWLVFDGCTFDGDGIPDPNRSMECDLLTISSDYPDYAILRAKSNVVGLKSLPLKRSEKCADGSTVYALGYPSVVSDLSASKFGTDDITITNGIVSKHMALPTKGNSQAILHTAQTSAGNSGGPLVDESGAVVGLSAYGFGEEVADRSVAIYSDYIIEALKAQSLPYYEVGSGVSVVWIGVGVGAATVIALAVFFILKSKKKTVPAAPAGTASVPQPGAYRLRCSDGTTYTVSGPVTTIGRDSSCQIRLPESAAKVSRRHCTLELSGGTLVLTDIGSSNGTFIHGKRIPANSRIALKEGSQFSLGGNTTGISFTVTR